MSDPSHGAADTAFPALADAPAPAPEPLPAGEGGGGALAEGGRWRTYRIGRAVGGCFIATDATAMEEVLLHSRPINERTELRRETWERLLHLPQDRLVSPREAIEEDGRRYEIYALPAGIPLREWAASHRPTPEEIETLVRQIAQELDALHAAGIVHLQLLPTSIFIESGDGGLRVQLGGLEAATLFEQSELVPISVNPFWAPPEAAGLFRHKAGDGLCAWDWWTLGRVVQELVHGSHVFGQLFGRDVSAEPFELRARAEAVLLERDSSGVRAGAVELLPETAGPRLRALLRGLLATARDGRWRGGDILRWLQSGSGPDRYDLPRDARLFWWRRQSFTVPEAAAYFLQPDYAFDGLQLLFPPPGREAESMRAFLAETPALRAAHDRVTQILGFVDTLPWQQNALTARRAAVAGLAWRALAPSDGPRLSVQRWAVDAAGLQEMLADAPPAEAMQLARVLGLTAYRRAVETVDSVAGRTLALLAETGFEALGQGVARGWIEAGNEEAHARLLWFSFEPDPELQARRERLRTTYATVRDQVLSALLAKERPTRTDLVLLAYLGENARNFGFVTHGEWTAERATTLRNGAVQARTVVFWQRAGRFLLFAPALLGAWPAFLALWLPAIAISSAAGGWLWGFLLGLFALLVRALAWASLQASVRKFAGGAWRLADGVRRARNEVAAAGANLPAAERKSALAAFETARAGLQELTPGTAPLAAPPRFRGLWALAILVQALPVAICVAPWLGIDLAREQRETGPVRLASSSVVSVGADHALYEITDDGFGPRRRGPLRAWDVPPVEPRPMSVSRLEPASPNQRAYARVGGELLLEPYPRHDLRLTLAVPVPSGGLPIVVLYDTETRELADQRAFQLREAPADKAWYWLGNRRVVYLGPPPRLPALQNSLAQP